MGICFWDSRLLGKWAFGPVGRFRIDWASEVWTVGTMAWHQTNVHHSYCIYINGKSLCSFSIYKANQ